jgi:phytoene dehydrogenase-like protein
VSDAHDAVVIGSGPNGLAAAVYLAAGGASVLVLEAAEEIGGGVRTSELTLPGFVHDECSACHPMGVLSPYLSTLPLADHGLEWVRPPASVAHPLDEGPAVMLWRSVSETAAGLGADGPSYRTLIDPYLKHSKGLLEDLLAPVTSGVPNHPLLMARFGLNGLRPAGRLATGRFRDARARALFAGCAAHAILPLERMLTGAVGHLFLLTAHLAEWPVVKGGSKAIASSLASYLGALGGRIETGAGVRSPADLPPARVYLFDTSPNQLADVCESALPARYVKRLRRYRYGPGAFKMDWALDGPIPWTDPHCLEASTVHLGGTLEEIAAGEAAVWRGEHPERPYVLLVQQSQFDSSRAPEGRHTGYAYCHVPPGSTVDLTDVVERQVERFAPGFRDRILARRATRAGEFELRNPNYVGGAITGGVADLPQAFARPVARLNPYATPNGRIFICSASSPPGGGVHGMCGYHAARGALKRLERHEAGPLLTVRSS